MPDGEKEPIRVRHNIGGLTKSQLAALPSERQMQAEKYKAALRHVPLPQLGLAASAAAEARKLQPAIELATQALRQVEMVGLPKVPEPLPVRGRLAGGRHVPARAFRRYDRATRACDRAEALTEA